MRINLHFELAPGDCWALIPLLRDFAEQQPAHELCPVTPSNEVFAGLPFYRAPRPKPDLDLRFRFTPDRVSDGCAFYGTDGVSTMPGVFYDFITRSTGLLVERRTGAPEVFLSAFERRWSAVPLERPVCVLNAGHKADIPVKDWGFENFSAVVAALRDRVLFVQVGANRAGFDFHRPVPGALDLIGKTSLRELAALVYHADFVLTGISQLHHLAGIQAYKPRRCITLAGAREPSNWANCWSRPGVTWHWLDAQDCRGNPPGCWRSTCPECSAMASITPETVINLIKEQIA